jgi:predicted alpha-1,2-mannosidase
MNFWMPQTGKMGDGWAYTYASDKIRGFKQTHQPSPWINDYGQFSIMPMTGRLRIDQEQRACWFSHKAEKATPYYYSVYLSEYNLTTEIAPTERCAYFRFTFPETKDAYIVIDAFDRGSYVKVIPEENKIVGYTTRNSGGVPRNFKNYFVIEFDKPFTFNKVWADYHTVEKHLELQSNHVGAAIGFSTKKGEQVHAKVASSFISPEQAELNLKEIGKKTFEQTKEAGRKAWNDVLGRIKIEDNDENRMRTFYSCLYRSVLFPRMFYEVNAQGETVHYSPYNGEVRPGYMFTDTGFWDTFRCLFPFVNLVYPSMGEKMQEGLLNTYQESGFFPEWASPGHRGCMVGNNSASVVADAFMKNVTKADAEKMYEGLLKGANSVHPRVSTTGRRGYEYYNKMGYVPYDVKINESLSLIFTSYGT